MNGVGRAQRRHGIGTRLALFVAALVFSAMVLAFNAERFVAQLYTAKFAIDQSDGGEGGGPDTSSDGTVRDDLGRSYVSEAEWEKLMERTERFLGIGLAALGTLFALGVGLVVSRVVTQRVRDLARAVQSPVAEGQELPGPFVTGRMDEIGVLAAALNVMRIRIQDLVALLAERDRERRSWIALVSHDLRNPLQALTACIDRSVQEARRIQDDTRRRTMQELLGTARLDVDRFEVMTLDLLDLARLDADDSLNLEPVPPAELARNAAAGLRVLAEVQGRRLDVKVAPRCPELLADGRRVLRALENLLRNAIQHAERRVELRVEPSASKGAVRFSVDDDGPGLPTLADGTVDIASLGAYKSRDDSAGLGLVVARRVAEAHGGLIGAYNRPAPAGSVDATVAITGATVWIEVPMREGLRRKGRNGAAADSDSDSRDDYEDSEE